MKKTGFKTVIIMLLTIFTIALSGCKWSNRYAWQHIYDAYTKKTDRFIYQSFNATVTEESFAKIKSHFKVTIDIDEYLERYKDYPKAEVTVYEYQSQFFYFVDESIEILEEAGFFDVLSSDTVITLTVNNCIGWTTWAYPVFAVEVDGTTYLDFDTGYDNVINYVRAKIDYYS